MPPGSPLAPRARPGGVLARLARLPEREVERVLLELGAARLLSLVHRLRVAVGEPPVGREAPDPEVDVPGGLVGVPGGDQVLDQRDDRADRLGGLRLVVGPADAERVGVRPVGGDHPLGMLRRRDPGLARGVVDLVVDVGEVDHERRRVALVGEEAAQQREDHVRPRVADVDRPVGGRAAGVDPDLPPGPGIESLHLAGERVPDRHITHSPTLLAISRSAGGRDRPIDWRISTDYR